MDIESLSKHLNNGEQWGFRTSPDSSEYLGWVLISKRNPAVIFPYHASQDMARYERLAEESAETKMRPFHVSVRELKKTVHESGEYESTEDYRVRDNYYFSTLEEVLNFLSSKHLQLEDINSRFDIDAP
jgi:hypothetical protein